MKKLLLIVPIVALMGCTNRDSFVTPKMMAVAELHCNSGGGVERVQGLDMDQLTKTGWESRLIVLCMDGSYIETPRVDNSNYR